MGECLGDSQAFVARVRDFSRVSPTIVPPRELLRDLSISKFSLPFLSVSIVYLYFSAIYLTFHKICWILSTREWLDPHRVFLNNPDALGGRSVVEGLSVVLVPEITLGCVAPHGTASGRRRVSDSLVRPLYSTTFGCYHNSSC